MKHLFYFLFFVLALTACNSNTSTDSSASSNDTTGQDTEATGLKFLSADLAMQDLAGQVKSMTNTTYACDDKGNIIKDSQLGDTDVTQYFDFDENGTMTRAFAFSQDDKGMTIKRNSKGQIESVQQHFAEIDFTRTDKFTYNENGRLASLEVSGYESNVKRTYTYANGVLASAKAIEAGEGEVYDMDLTYKIQETDDHGNWTKRMFTCQIKMGPDDGSGTVEDTDTQYGVEVRKIVYY